MSFSKFFAQDNATYKLASSLVLIAAMLQSLVSLIPSPEAVNVLLIVIGVLGVAAQFFKANKVVTRSGWVMLAYAIVSYLATAEGLKGSVWIVSVAAMLKVYADWSIISTPPPTEEPKTAEPVHQPKPIE